MNTSALFRRILYPTDQLSTIMLRQRFYSNLARQLAKSHIAWCAAKIGKSPEKLVDTLYDSRYAAFVAGIRAGVLLAGREWDEAIELAELAKSNSSYRLAVIKSVVVDGMAEVIR